jgi:outer membrane protein assembly factor BamA
LIVLLTSPFAFEPARAQTERPPNPPSLPEPIKDNRPIPEADKEAEKFALDKFFKKGDYTIIPLPAFAYNRNESYYIGALAPILKQGKNDEVEAIIAPQYLWNPFIGHTGTLNYYYYPSNTAQYQVVLSYSEKVARDFNLSYKDVGALGGRWILGADVNWFKNPFGRFFGFGNVAPERNESNYTDREFLVKGSFGINLNPDFAILFTERYREVRIENGLLSSLPSTTTAFPQVAGIEGAKILGHRLTAFYDTRDNLRTPTKGTYAVLFGEFNQGLDHNSPYNWWRYTLDARTLIPHWNNRMVFVPHLLFDGVLGDTSEVTSVSRVSQRAIPFYERPMLGGENTLRAFGLNRFISNSAILFNFEERYRAVDMNIMDHTVDLELAPFVDLGRVQQQDVGEKLNFQHWQVNPGVGIRLLARPHIVGRLDVAYGKDGANAFVGLDYPF